MADEEQKIVISVDKSAADSSLKAIKALETEHAKLGQTAKKLDKVFADSASSQKRAAKEATNNAASTKQLNAALNAQTTEAKQAKTAIEAYEESLRSVQKGGADLSGDVASSFGGLRGAASAVGLGGVSPAFDIAEAGADIGEFAPKLKVQLESVGNAMRLAEGASGTFATKAGDAIGGLLGVSGSMGSLIAVAAPVGIALGAVALVLGDLGRQAQVQVNQINAIFDAQREVNQEVIDGLTTEQAIAEIERLQESIDKEKETLATANAAYAQAVNQFGGFLASVIPQSSAIASQIATSEANITSAETKINEYNQSLTEGELAINDIERAEAELAQTRESEALAAIQVAEQSAMRIAQLEEQKASLINSRAIQDSNAYANEKLERKFAQEDEKAELTQHLAALADIRADGAAKVAAIEQELASLPAQQAEALADIASKGTKELNKLSQDYFANQIKATQDFAKESGRIASDTAKAAKRLAEDLADNLADAARDNDVVAFLELQKDGQKELKRNAEDAGEAEKRRAEDFAQQQNEQRQAFQQRQTEILNNLAEERAQVAQTFAEKRAALELQRQQEIANTQQAIANANARYQAEQAREAQAAQRDKERAALRQSQEDAAFQRQIKAISDKTNAELAGLQRVAAAAASLGSSSSSAKSGFGKSGSGLGYSGLNKNNPFNKSGASNKGGGNTFVVNATIGDVVNSSQVSNAINQSLQQFGSAVIGGLAKAQGG